MGVQFRHLGFLAIGLSLALAVLMVSATQIAHAAAFTVNTTNDTVDATPGDGICADVNGDCSLRGAIREANALAGTDTVTVPAGTYTLTIAGVGEQQNATGDLDIRDSLNLVGADAASTIIQAGTSSGSAGNGIDRVLEVIGSITVNISDVTIRYGQLGGGAGGGGLSISSGGTTTLDECIVADNYVSSVNFGGGGIFLAAGSLTINNSTIAGNVHNNRGGGVFNDNGGTGGAVIINNSTFSANSSGQGGAIATDGPLTISNSTFYGNSATSGGAIANNASTVTLELDSRRQHRQRLRRFRRNQRQQPGQRCDVRHSYQCRDEFGLSADQQRRANPNPRPVGGQQCHRRRRQQLPRQHGHSPDSRST